MTLEEQDRSLWDQEQIGEGLALVQKVLATNAYGHYTLQAALAAEHCRAPSAALTDWARIVRLYDRLEALYPSPVVELNRAVAMAMAKGPEAGLTLVVGYWEFKKEICNDKGWQLRRIDPQNYAVINSKREKIGIFRSGEGYFQIRKVSNKDPN